MIKRNELADPQSCINRAADDEPVFVLRAKDPAAPDVIRRWINERVVRGLNTHGDQKLWEALEIAHAMEHWHMRWIKKP